MLEMWVQYNELGTVKSKDYALHVVIHFGAEMIKYGEHYVLSKPHAGFWKS